jgi:hypothetical protein
MVIAVVDYLNIDGQEASIQTLLRLAASYVIVSIAMSIESKL